MEITQEQAKARLESPANLANRLREFRLGKKKVLDEDNSILTLNANNKKLPRLPEPIVEEIAERAQTGLETQKEIADDYGVTQAAVSNIKRVVQEEAKAAQEDASNDQKYTTVRIPKNPAEKTPPSPMAMAKEQAIEKLMMAMGLLTQDKLEKAKLGDWSKATMALARAHSSLNGNNQTNAANVNLVIYAPEVRGEECFKVIEIGTAEDGGSRS